MRAAVQSTAASLAALVLSAVVAAANTAQPELCKGMIYLGGGHANALLVDVPTRQATYTRHIEDPEDLLKAMRGFRQLQNISTCGERCIDMRLEEGRIVLAFRPGEKGLAYEAAGVSFVIEDVAKGFGLGRGDLYWIGYRSKEPNNPAGVFVYSTTQGVLSLSMTDRDDPRSSTLGSTLSLLAVPGLLSDVCALR
jgi:hypothetical protein